MTHKAQQIKRENSSLVPAQRIGLSINDRRQIFVEKGAHCLFIVKKLTFVNEDVLLKPSTKNETFECFDTLDQLMTVMSSGNETRNVQ